MSMQYCFSGDAVAEQAVSNHLKRTLETRKGIDYMNREVAAEHLLYAVIFDNWHGVDIDVETSTRVALQYQTAYNDAQISFNDWRFDR